MKNVFSGNVVAIVFFCQFLFIHNSNGQGWASIDNGIGAGINDTASFVSALTSDSGNLYVAGYFYYAGNNSGFYNVAEWNGNVWSELYSGIASKDTGSGLQLTTYNGNVIVGGIFNSAGGNIAFNIAQWDGTNWSAVGDGIGLGFLDSFSTVAALAVADTTLYAGGFFDTAGSIPANNIAQWNGTAWSSMGQGIGTGVLDNTSWVYSIATNDSVVYAGGFFSVVDSTVTAYNIAEWNNSAWSPLASGIGNGAGDTTSAVYAMTIFAGNLIAGGFFHTAGGNAAFNIALWDGSNWLPMGSGIGGGAGDDSSAVYSLAVYNGNLYAGGYFTLCGADTGIYNIARWNGSGWEAVDSGINSATAANVSDVYALNVYNGGLYAGGYFDYAGGMPAFNIAEYQNSEGIKQVTENNSVTVYPNPNNGMLNISMQNVADRAQLQIYNLLGVRVYQAQITDNNTAVNLRNEASGPYFYRVCSAEGNVIATGKFIIQ